MIKKSLFGLAAFFLVLFFIAPSLLFAGKLGDFEEEATKKEDTAKIDSSDSSSNESHHHGRGTGFGKDRDCDSFVGCCFYTFIDLATVGLYEGGRYSYNERRYNKSLIGSPILPTVSLDTDYQNVESDVYSINNRIEFGYGPFGFQYKELRYFEEDPEDELKIYQLNYLHRMTDGKSFRIDLGLGSVTVKGDNSNTGFSMLTPIYVFLPKNFSLFVRPNWGWINGNSIRDYKLGFLFSREYFSLQGGYRFVKSGQETLNGPFVGINLHY